jgi:murein DD-endopeptidase
MKPGAPLAAAAILTLAGGTAAPQTRQGIDVNVRFAPVLANAGSEQALRYELHITNFARDPLTLRGVQIIDRGRDRPIASLTGDMLRSALRPVRQRSDEDAPVLAPGRTTLLFLDAAVSKVASPVEVTHRLRLTDGQSEFEVESAGTRIALAPPSDLGPPLKGGPWVAVYQPSMDGGHRRVAYAVNGQAKIPGRFAIDWFKVDERGAHVSGAGAPVLAVRDGVVVAARDDFSDPAPDSRPLGPELDNDTGNFLVLDIGQGRYAFYEHLKQGLRVKLGERVRRGQIIAFVGATGHVTGPHLHFHVADASSPLDAEGLPFGFRSFERLGAYESISAYGRGGLWQPGPGAGSGLPPPNAVVRFPD